MVCRGDGHAVEGEEAGAMRASEEKNKEQERRLALGLPLLVWADWPANKKREWVKI